MFGGFRGNVPPVRTLTPMSSNTTLPTNPQTPHLSQKSSQTILIWGAGAFCIYAWDWILCLPLEYQRIWRKKINSISVLYLANRYFGFLQFSFAVSLMADAWGSGACKYVFIWKPVGALISTALSEMILGARVYALYAQNRMIATMLCSILLVEVVIGAYTISMTHPPAPDPNGVILHCVAVPPALGWMIEFWSLPALYDTIVFLLTAWKAYDFWRKDLKIPLITVLWRDGVIYFFAIFSMNLTNIIIFSVAPNSLTWLVNLTPTLIFTVTLSCRLVLNIRDPHARTVGSAQLSDTALSSIRDRRSPTNNFIPKSSHEWIDISPRAVTKLETWSGDIGPGETNAKETV